MTNDDIKIRIEEFQKRALAAKEEIFQAVMASNEVKREVEASMEAKLNLQIAENLARDAEKAARKAKKALSKIQNIKRVKNTNKIDLLHEQIATDFRAAEKATNDIKTLLDNSDTV